MRIPSDDDALRERFWTMVGPGSEDDCWEWLGNTSNGYGRFYDRGSYVFAHRFAFADFYNRPPAAETLDHLCRNRSCVNPTHLEEVTSVDNVMRGESPAAKFARATHCIRGHEFTPANTYSAPGKRERRCRICINITQRARYAAARRRPLTEGVRND